MNFQPRELLLYGMVAFSSLVMTAYTVHMMVGGIVSEATEHLIMVGACLVVFLAIVFMAWDVTRRRRGR